MDVMQAKLNAAKKKNDVSKSLLKKRNDLLSSQCSLLKNLLTQLSNTGDQDGTILDLEKHDVTPDNLMHSWQLYAWKTERLLHQSALFPD
jgi:hypothetical protein